MRIRRIAIRQWRNFRDLEIQIDESSPLVCLVGANGTGKTHILELISACAHRIGLSSGVDIPRGDPFADPQRDFELQIFLAPGVSEALDTMVSQQEYAAWDRTLTVFGNNHQVTAGGFVGPNAVGFGAQIVQQLRQSSEVYHLTLDADRAFPRRDLPAHEMAQAFEQNWNDQVWNKNRAFATTRTLYEEWIKYCLARENKSANLFYQAARRATENGTDAPVFADTFASYRSALREVMPHLLFAGADQERKAILFDTSGLELRFDQLSGGEREIAFLVGQIDRFGLKNGIFLLDEPELHLNPDLVRSWVTYLASTVAEGQVWLATHSLEAVEAAGQSSTLLIERDSDTRMVNSVGPMSGRPVLSALSRAVGTPAFAISALRFIFIEGEEAIGERERYRRITQLGPDTRFIECGSCSEVMRRLQAIKALAMESDQPIRIGGVIDRDWRTQAELNKLGAEQNLMTLPVHEVENFFVTPGTLESLARRNGIQVFDPFETIKEEADHRAGGWILQSAISDPNQSDVSNLSSQARELIFALDWEHIALDPTASFAPAVAISGLNSDSQTNLLRRLSVFARIYKRHRESHDLWRVVEGKEIAKRIAPRVGFANSLALELAATTFWDRPENVPDLLAAFRAAVRDV